MKLYWILLPLVFLFFFSIALLSPDQVEPTPRSKSLSTAFAYDNRTFLNSISKKFTTVPGTPRVIVLPHHLLASPLIAEGVSLLVPSAPKTLLILSPNHANTGQCDIVTSQNSWDTPFGSVEVDQDLLLTFLGSKTVCLDDSAISVEHGIAGLLPFIKYYIPGTKILPFVLKKDVDPEVFKIFVDLLTSVPKTTPVLSSVDFSHGLSLQESLVRDELTEKLIRNLDYLDIQDLSSEYLDSPASLIAVLKLLESENAAPSVLVHTNSSIYNGNPKGVTSYFLLSGGQTSPTSSTPPVILGDLPAGRQDAGIHPIMATPESFTLLFGGDVMLGRSVNTRIIKYADFSWPFQKVFSLLSEADLTMVNLESPFRSGCKPTDSGMVFCADPRSVEGLKTAGIDIVNLANNHINNQGIDGIDETINILNKNNIAFVGADPRVRLDLTKIFTIKNTRIAFLGFTDIASGAKEISNASPDNIKNQISEAKKDADLVIATFHWGNEYSRRSLHQQELARIAIDAGADVIIGHHPHWVQEIEEYRGKPIYYSLGNLVFDQMWSEETRKGLLVKLTFSGPKLMKQEQFPVKIFDYGQPTLVPSP